jgi:Transposase and inactivated derivatives
LKLFESIKTLSSEYSLAFIFKTLNINPSSYYYWLANHQAADSRRLFIIQNILMAYSDSNGIYGAPKITAILMRKNIHISISTTSRFMNLLGIKSIVSKKFRYHKSTMSSKEKSLIINLVKDLDVTRINQVWSTDITYIHTIHEGSFYLVSYIDYYSKKVVAWGLFDNQKTDVILETLSLAIKKRNPLPELITHSDKGPQFRSKSYRKFHRKHNFAVSYTSLNHSCDENAAQESFHASLKKEAVYLHELYTKEDAYRVIFDFIEGRYNPTRIHSSIRYLSPDEFEKSIKNT